MWLTFALEASADGRTWRTVADHTERAVLPFATRTTRGVGTARYVRLSITNPEDRTASVWEVRGFGPPAR